jgi:hypothetical protein
MRQKVKNVSPAMLTALLYLSADFCSIVVVSTAATGEVGESEVIPGSGEGILDGALLTRALSGDADASRQVVSAACNFVRNRIAARWGSALQSIPCLDPEDFMASVVNPLVLGGFSEFRELAERKGKSPQIGLFINCLKQRADCRVIESLRAKQSKTISLDEAGGQALAGPLETDPCDPSTEMHTAELLKVLDEVIHDELTEIQQIVVVQKLVRTPSKEIAAEVLAATGKELSEGAVDMVFHHAKKILRRALLKRGIHP